MFEALARIRHRRLRRDLSAYLDEMLSPGARRRLEEHLDTCAACRRELAELGATRGVLSELPLAEVPRSFILAAAPEPAVGPRPVARRLEFGLRLATAGAAFALAVVVIGDFAGLPGDEEKEEAPARMQPLEEQPALGITGGALTPDEGWGPYTSERAGEEEAATAVPTPEKEVVPPATGYTDLAEPAATGAGEEPTPEGTPVPSMAEGPETGAVGEVTPEATPPPAMPEGLAAGTGEELTPEATPAPTFSLESRAAELSTLEEAAATQDAIVAEGEGGLSREDAVRWVEIGLGAGVGILVLSWAFVLRHVRMRAQSQ